MFHLIRTLRTAFAAVCLTTTTAHAQTAASLDFDALVSTHSSRAPHATKAVRHVVRDSVIIRTTTTPITAIDSRGVATRVAIPIVLTASPLLAETAAATAPPTTAPVAAVPSLPTSVTGLLQLWSVAGDNAYRNTYRLRRAEVKVTSDLGRQARATVMIDLAKSLALQSAAGATTVSQSTRILQDAFLSFPTHRLQFDIGQFRLPLGNEGSTGAASLEDVERSLMSMDRARGGTFGDVRDIGSLIRGRSSLLDVQLGVFNGSGENQNDVDHNVAKSVVGRVVLHPPHLVGLQLGASGTTAGAPSADKPVRDRIGVDIALGRGRTFFQAEGMRGHDGAITRMGWYSLARWSVDASTAVHVRVDAWDPDISSESTPADARERDYIAGFNWLPPATRLKVQLDLTDKTFNQSIAPSRVLAVLNLQASW